MQNSILTSYPSYMNFAFGFRNPHLINSQSPSIDSPSSPLERTPKDWMSNLQTLESINKISMMNVLKVSSTLQTTKTTPIIRRVGEGFQRRVDVLRRGDEKIEPGMEEPAVVKKIKVNYEAPNAISSLVDKQLQKLPERASQSMKQLLAVAAQRNIKSTGTKSFIKGRLPNKMDKLEQIISVTFDKKRRDFIYYVEWKQRVDGTRPENSLMTKDELMKVDPALIISYYENQVKRTLISMSLQSK